jgi:hypothetical protein
MNRRLRLRSGLLGLVAAIALGGAEARAHFLFIRIGPMAEAGRSAEVYFSEQAEAGDPQFVARIAQTKLWVQPTPGQFEPLTVHKLTDRLRATVPASGSVAVVGACEYGVLARPNQAPFLLRYYPKAIAGKPDELNRMRPRPEVPFEIMATIEGERLRLVALKDGKPVPGAEFHAVDADLTEAKFAAGTDGEAAWTPPAPGQYSVYARDSIKQTGEADGKSYEEVRSFATLAFSWPIEPKGADPEAVALFEDALSTRARWKDFPGFTAKLAGTIDGHPFTGKVTIHAEASVEVETDDPVARKWLRDQLESLAMHRLDAASTSAGARPRPVLRFADDQDDHPLGRLLTFVGGHFASSYRVKDRQITVVNRHMGKRNMTINVLDNDKNREGRYLPRSYLVQYWDAASGTLDHVESVQERWHRFRSWDLPTAHTVTDASGAGFSVKSVTLSEHRLLEVK